MREYFCLWETFEMTTSPSLLRTFLQDLVGHESSALRPLQTTNFGTVATYTRRVQGQQLSTLHRTIPSGLFASLLAIAAVVVPMWGNAPKSHLLIWIVAMIVILAPQAMSYFFHLRVVRRDGIEAIKPLLVLLPFLIEGLAWGSSAMYISILQPILYQGILLFMIALVAISAALFFPVYLPALYVFEIPLLTLVSLTLFTQGSDLHTRLGFAALMVLGAILYLGRNFNRSLTAAIVTNLVNEDLVDELTVQKELAERADVAKTRFLAHASHDLRQPLHTIGLLVALLRSRERDTEDQRVVDKLSASAVSMDHLLGGLLDISKLDAGIVAPDLSEFPLANLMEAIALSFMPQAEAKGLAWRMRPTRAIVRSDAIILERIVANLVANALRYTRKGGILVGCRRRGDRTRIEIWDTGVGISEEYIDDIFQEFFQLNNPERDRTKGLGLGLSIVRRSADLLGHPITVKSIEGRGSCFYIEVPLIGQGDAAPSAYRVEANDTSDLFGVFVVIIDDEEDVRFATQSLLQEWGCHTLCAASADEVVSQLADHLRSPELIISDYRLRDNETGIEAIGKLRAALGEPVPGILVTGDIGAREIKQLARSEFPVAHKPVSAENLLQLIRNALATAGVATESGAFLKHVS
jgi:two-component system, sensor histidine kinase